jgi:hypothetical protein
VPREHIALGGRVAAAHLCAVDHRSPNVCDFEAPAAAVELAQAHQIAINKNVETRKPCKLLYIEVASVARCRHGEIGVNLRHALANNLPTCERLF